MPRIARVKKGEYCTYHIIQRGNERKEIFKDNRDRYRFLEALIKAKGKYNFKIYAYCLMSNHVHLIIDANGSDISQLMKSINVSYVMYFNRKHKRVGHLFHDRFRSEIVDNEPYLIELSRYIHLNPVRAKMASNPLDYRWSSYAVYLGVRQDNLVDTSLILGQFADNPRQAGDLYREYVNRDDDFFEAASETAATIEPTVHNPCDNINLPPELLDMKQTMELVAQTARENGLLTTDITQKRTPYNSLRDHLIRQIRKQSTLTLSQIGSLFNLSESAISRILSNGDGS